MHQILMQRMMNIDNNKEISIFWMMDRVDLERGIIWRSSWMSFKGMSMQIDMNMMMVSRIINLTPLCMK